MIDNVGILVGDSARARFYLYQTAYHGVAPSHALLLNPATEQPELTARSRDTLEIPDEYDVPEELSLKRPVRKVVRDLNIPYVEVNQKNPNSPEVAKLVKNAPVDYFVYGGPGGVILEDELLNKGKRFLHVHAGYLPDYRGSTTIYYSLLAEEECGATAFFFTESIDEGPILKRKKYHPPDDRENIDLIYDPYIRSDLLVDVLEEYRETGDFETEPQDPDDGETYYVVHPLLKHYAILGRSCT